VAILPGLDQLGIDSEQGEIRIHLQRHELLHERCGVTAAKCLGCEAVLIPVDFLERREFLIEFFGGHCCAFKMENEEYSMPRSMGARKPVHHPAVKP
jgi:hypothetical protein